MWSALFPGQGSQFPGMGRFLFDNFKVVVELFEEASDRLHLDFKKLCFEGSDKDLALTANTQPALLLISTACWQVVRQTCGFSFDAAAGHSVGEYAALVATGGLKFGDALQAVRKRGELMQSAVPVGEGGMVAVLGLTAEQVIEVCAWAERSSGHKPVEPANFNAPDQVVISGQQNALDYLLTHFDKEQLKPVPKKARLIPLNVSAPFHSSMMKPAEEEMRQVLENLTFESAAFAVVQNFTAQPVKDASLLRENLIRQISAPVRWVESLKAVSSLGVTRAIELGPGKVIAGLVRKTLGDQVQMMSLGSLDDLKALEEVSQVEEDVCV